MVPSPASDFLNTNSPGTNLYYSLPYDDMENLGARQGIHNACLVFSFI